MIVDRSIGTAEHGRPMRQLRALWRPRHSAGSTVAFRHRGSGGGPLKASRFQQLRHPVRRFGVRRNFEVYRSNTPRSPKEGRADQWIPSVEILDAATGRSFCRVATDRTGTSRWRNNDA